MRFAIGTLLLCILAVLIWDFLQPPTVPVIVGPPPAPQATAADAGSDHDGIYRQRTGPNGSDFMTDGIGMALYTYDNDSAGASACDGACARAWPPYVAQNSAARLPDFISLLSRSDGTLQYAWKGMPLYHYAEDKNMGDAAGDGVDGRWHLIQL